MRGEEQNREEGEMAQKKLGGGKRLGKRERLAQKVGRREKLVQKVGRREIYTPVPPPSLMSIVLPHCPGCSSGLSYFNTVRTTTLTL